MMFGATPYASSPYGTLAVPFQLTVSGTQGAFATGTASARSAQKLLVVGTQGVFTTGTAQARAGQKLFVTGSQAQFAAGTVVAKGAASVLPLGAAAQYYVGTVAIQSGQTLQVSGSQASFVMGLAQARTRQRVEVTGPSARFYTNGTLVWYDVPLPVPGMWVDIFQDQVAARAPVNYATGPYALGAYSGDVLETLVYDSADDAWGDIDTTQPDSWRDIIL